MKRKRGRKGKSKKVPKVGTTEAEPSTDNFSGEDVSGPDDIDKDETNSKMDIETPSTGTDQPEKPPAVSAPVVADKPVGRLVYNRVKLKIKPSKALEPQVTSSDVHTHSDTDKSSLQHIGLIDKQVVTEKVEDSANSPETNLGVLATQPKKTGCIIIKSSKSFSSSLSPCSNPAVPQAEKIHQKVPELVSRDSVDNNFSNPAVPQAEKIHQKEPELVPRDSVYNKQELIASLEVPLKSYLLLFAVHMDVIPDGCYMMFLLVGD